MPICDDWGVDLCQAGVCEEDCFGAGRTCANSFDDNITTFWDSCQFFPHWIGYKFTSPKKIGRVRVNQLATEWSQNFKVYGSNTIAHDDDWDLKSWVELYEITDGQGGIWQAWEWTQITAYQYVKLHSLSGDGAAPDYWAINEIEMFECQDVLVHLSGTVKEKGVPVQRTVRSYIRSSGQLYDSIVSNPDGTYVLDAPNTTTLMFIVAFDDDPGDIYNALIVDRVYGIQD